uniref:Uncharacterized protein n=1 Tax=viral metagenome TaxID=1070528 RepID=A0A6M3LA92_9ZZZZ
MALSDVLSNKTKTAPVASELSQTDRDYRIAMEWEVGDPEPQGTYVRSRAHLTRLRNDLRRGVSEAANYKHNVIWVDTFKPIGKQLEELKK